MSLLQQYVDYIHRNNLFTSKDKLLLAVSGGIDSVVLCELCKQAGYDFGIAHCNFQLRDADSDRDEKFVAAIAGKYNVALHTTRFETKKIATEKKLSTQETARMLRYEWFEQVRKNNSYNYILTAHHGDDNIETVLMNFFRGTGIKGVRGIGSKHGSIVRPLLFTRRKALEEFLKIHELEYVNDYTNEQDDYSRNFFRHQVIPLVEKVFPGAQDNLLSNIARFRDVEELYEQAIDVHKKKLLEHRGNEVHIPVLKLKNRQPLQTIVYEIIKEYGFSAPQTADVISLLDRDTGKHISSSSHRIIRNRKWLIIAHLEAKEASTILIEKGNSSVENATFSLQFSTEPVGSKLPPSNMIACLDALEIKYPLFLRKWKQGDYFYPLGMPKKKKLSRFFIDQKLSKTEKENVWVIEADKKIIWVIGHRIDDRFKVTGKTREILKIICNYLPN